LKQIDHFSVPLSSHFMNILKTIFVGVFALTFAVNHRAIALSDGRPSHPNSTPFLSQSIRQPLNFQMPDRGAPGDRQSDAGGRGGCTDRTEIIALVPPKNLGYTLSDRPTFWFYLTESQSSSLPAEFNLANNQGKTIVEFPLTVRPGLIKVDLPETIALEEAETNYDWRFSVICEPGDRSGDLAVRGRVIKREIDEDLQTQIQGQEGRELALIYAANSLWFDLLTLVIRLRKEDSKNPVYREDWQELLKAIGLEEFG
jgi:hypothetical protein